MKKAVLGIALFIALLLAGFLLFFSSQQVVDEDYLKSEKYQSLKNNIEREKETNRDEKSVFHAVVEKMLANESNYSRNLPLRIQPTAIDSFPEANEKIALGNIRIENSRYHNYSFYGILAANKEKFNAVVFLMVLPGVYKKNRMILVTAQNSSILDMATIGQYDKNITEEVNTDLFIDEDLYIRAEMNKLRFYPIQQSTTVHYRYSISKKGNINVTVL